MRLLYAVPLLGALAAALACSGAASPIVGEWQYLDVHSGAIADLFFNTDGSCGNTITYLGPRTCRYTCTYRTSGNDLTIDYEDGDAGTVDTVSFSISGTTLTLDLPDGGEEEQYTRVNSSGNNTCP
jgi:hypothetical protein